MRIAALLTGVGVAALALSGCSTSSTTVEKTTVTETVTSSASSSASSTTSTSGPSAPPAGAALPQPPAGATQIRSSDDDGMVHARYSVEGQTPKQVADYYTGIWSGEGYTIDDTSSGGDPGKYGGSGASAKGSKSGTFVAVDAGAGNGEPTYFDVCQGTNEELVMHCGKGRHGD